MVVFCSHLTASLKHPQVCFEDDGRISVNTELCAASKVYAAGSVAKYPNSSTGNATVAGEGTIDGVKAGEIAALNMSRDYIERQGSWKSRSEKSGVHSFAAHSVPTWRSDVTPYTSLNREIVPSSLSSIGIQALCVGECDSERHSTRGFWWTNTSAQRRLARLIEEEDAEHDGLTRRKTRRRITRRRRQLGLVTPVYGIGVVYYLDKVGRIRGIMTWGLPFSSVRSPYDINQSLLNRLKDVIVTNGGVSALDAEENYHIMNAFLAKESQQLVKLAVKGTTSDATGTYHKLDGPVEGFTKPLYRYTEPRPARRNSVNVLKRNDQGGMGVLGEDLYARDELALEEEVDLDYDENGDGEHSQANLPTPMYPINVVNLAESSKGSAASADSLTELNQFLAIQRGWENNDNRARPGKEDPLWLRPGDERKNTSQRQLMIEYYRNLMFPHRS